MNNTHEQTWKQYSSAWGPIKESARRTLFTEVLSQTCRYRDPLVSANGHEELNAYINDLQKQIPGAEIVTTFFRSHNQRCIARWELRGSDGTVLSDGISYGEFDDSGKLQAMNGFFDPLAPSS